MKYKTTLKFRFVMSLLARMVAVTILLTMWSLATKGQSPVPLQSPSSLTSENQTLDLENKKLALEREKLELEKLKAWLTAGTILIPVLVGLLALFGVISQIKSASKLKEVETKTAFELKAAEIVLSSGGPAKATARATVLRDLFPNRLPDNFPKSFDASIMPGSQHNDKLEFLKLVNDKPERTKEIIELWKHLFKWDEVWLPKT
ncbi:MAG TPA: hypothetical protein VJS64_02715 [Pyrinomonadaceae bacterium]|nr:hypothetical protein [Pyrinomonadaceae bacterium]